MLVHYLSRKDILTSHFIMNQSIAANISFGIDYFQRPIRAFPFMFAEPVHQGQEVNIFFHLVTEIYLLI